MAWQLKEGDGSLFVNDRKEASQQPDYKGSLMVGGVEYWISGWKKSSKDGTKKYLSLSARPKVQKTPSAPAAAAEEDDFESDSSLPF